MWSDAGKPEVKVFKFGEESLSDVIFVVGGYEFHCHRMALAARSPYFASMFTSSFKEKTQERIEIKADAVAFKRLMEIFYSGFFEDYKKVFQPRNIFGEVSATRIKTLWSEVYNVLELADRFLVLDITRKGVEYCMIVTNKSCEMETCEICATKLLLALRFQMTGYKHICKANRNTIGDTIDLLKPLQIEHTVSMDAIQFLCYRG